MKYRNYKKNQMEIVESRSIVTKSKFKKLLTKIDS